jgi:ectoine hydroxylase-related dioxygenase (phytanoyl-CoA dioxygenase family)
MYSDVSTSETIAQQFARDGFVLCESIFIKSQLDRICSHAEQIHVVAGTRNLLEHSWCRELAAALRTHPEISQALAPTLVAAQCTLFEKTPERNWLVGLHQDLSIPVCERVEHSALRGWSQKEGSWFVQAPLDVLEQMVAVRVHLDDCGADDGALRVVAGSHTRGRISNDAGIAMRDQVGESTCVAAAGDVLLMRPLLLHASSKSCGSSRRRLLHFVFGPPKLPFGLSWHNKV